MQRLPLHICLCNSFAEPAQDIKAGCLQTFKESTSIIYDAGADTRVISKPKVTN